jgi:preprotein translocase subunit Sec61beta
LRLGTAVLAASQSLYYLSLTAAGVILFDIATVITKGLLWTQRIVLTSGAPTLRLGRWRSVCGAGLVSYFEKSIRMAHPFITCSHLVLAGLMTYHYLTQAGSVPEPLTGVFCGYSCTHGHTSSVEDQNHPSIL